MRAILVRAALTGVAMLGAAGAARAEGLDPYLRASLGFDWSDAAVFSDADCLVGGYYGCGPGSDSLPLGAYGDFGGSAAVELGVGVHAGPMLRLEAVVGWHPGFAFTGEANFVNTPGDQPVSAAVNQFTAMAFAYVDLGPILGLTGRIQPFVGAGAGLAVNVLGPMDFEFPGLTQPAYTLTPGGTTVSGAYAVTAGISAQLSDRATLDLAIRRTDYGAIGTEAGSITVQRGVKTSFFDIGPTSAHLAATGVTVGLRFGF